MTGKTTATIRAFLAVALMAFAANCFLKYLWWTACYSAWQGIPKLAAQWRAAGARASFNGWCVIILELSSMALLFTILRLRFSNASRSPWVVPRVILSFVITIAGTTVLALVLSLVKQGMR